MEELKILVTELGSPPFQAQNLWKWLYEKRAEDYQDMSSLPTVLRGELADRHPLFSTKLESLYASKDGTVKQLVKLRDGYLVECVMIPDGDRRTACISTQVGCAMGCVFCASTKKGLVRNLEFWEIVEQILRLQAKLPRGERISNIVVMGIGEPFQNYDNLIRALQIIQTDIGIGARKITVSTVGLPKGIKRFSEDMPQINLAISLHAPNDELRTRIIPTNKGIGIQSILAAAREHFEATHRELTFEYILLSGVNDALHHAEELGALVENLRCTINLIPMNPIFESSLGKPGKTEIKAFQSILKDKYKIPTHVRTPRGDDVSAACGQLRLLAEEKGR